MPRVKSFRPAPIPTQSGPIQSEPKEETPSPEELVGENSSPVIPSASEESNNLPAAEQDFKSRDSSASPAPGVASPQNDNYGGYRPRYGNGGYQNGNRDYSDSPRSRFGEAGRDVPTEKVSGVLDIMPEGHGFLRPHFNPSNKDVYISASQIRRFSLRSGDLIEGMARPPKETERYFGLLQVTKINDEDAERLMSHLEGEAKVSPGSHLRGGASVKKRPHFGDLTAIYPNRHLKLETGKEPLSQRVIDLVAPIGFGQRGLIVSPPKAGKTTILKDIAQGLAKNYPDVILMAVLVGERPEEVTDISRSIKGDVIASNFDEPAEAQTAAAEIALERAKRLVEGGKDVVILLDSVTRLGRAYNLSVPPSGRTLSGGFDPVALYPPKHFFGSARSCEEGGSLTIIGTALVDTGSRMDDLIYEEFKGTGNMELHLDRKLAERRTYPAIDIESSGTRQEQLLFADDYYKQMIIMRRMLSILNENERTEVFLERLRKTDSNADFLKTLKDVK